MEISEVIHYNLYIWDMTMIGYKNGHDVSGLQAI